MVELIWKISLPGAYGRVDLENSLSQERMVEFAYWCFDGQKKVGEPEWFGLMTPNYVEYAGISRLRDLSPGVDYVRVSGDYTATGKEA
jgi:hypothetical protein